MMTRVWRVRSCQLHLQRLGVFRQKGAASCRLLETPQRGLLETPQRGAASCRLPETHQRGLLETHQRGAASCRLLETPQRGAASCRLLETPQRGLLETHQRAAASCRLLETPQRGAASCRLLETPQRGLLETPQRGAASCRLLETPQRGLLETPQRGLLETPQRGLTHSARRLESRNDSSSGTHTEEEEDLLEDGEVEQLFQEQIPTGITEAQHHRVFLVHPDVKWGSRKQHLTTAELMAAEAEGLVNTLHRWTVVDKIILSTKTPEKKRIFGKGNFRYLTEKIRQTAGVTAVFVNVDRLSPLSERDLEEAWGVKVFDRYSVVLHIFRSNARTKEAKLQISLAEIPLLRSRLKNDMARLDQQGGGSRYIGGSGETLLEVQQRLLKEREMKIRGALDRLRKKRRLLRAQRKHRELPVVSVLGYTNCGKTTLIKALTGDGALQPRNQLFATLDVTVHAGLLPSHVTVLYVDTIGFLSQLPHQLIDSFSATLEDIKHSDLLVHVRDISHPETLNQKVNVLNVLKNLQIPEQLMTSMIEVHNKVDLLEDYVCAEPGAVPTSALQERGLNQLKALVEKELLKSTGKQVLRLKVDLSTPQLRWLYKEAAVQSVEVNADEGSALVQVVISAAAHGRYKKLFQSS